MTATVDRYAGQTAGLSGPGDDAFAVTPSDGIPFSVAARALYVGGGGDVTVVTKSGAQVKFAAVPTGTLLPIRCTQVMFSGTTASQIVGIV